MSNRSIDPTTRAAVLESVGMTREVAARLGVSQRTVARLKAADQKARAAEAAIHKLGRPRLEHPSTATRLTREWRERLPTIDKVVTLGTKSEIDLDTPNGSNEKTRLPVPPSGNNASKPRFRGILGTHCESCGKPLKDHDKRPSGWSRDHPGPCSGAS